MCHKRLLSTYNFEKEQLLFILYARITMLIKRMEEQVRRNLFMQV